MNVVRLAGETDFDGWRAAARRLLRDGVPPESVEWMIGDGGSLFEGRAGGDTETPFAVPTATDSPAGVDAAPTFRVSPAFIELCRDVVLHSDPARFALLYRLLWRMREEPRLLQVATDADVSRARQMEKAIGRDLHKMHAFVRFRELMTPEGPVYVAWFEPTHHILEAAAPFFVRRFASMRWTILTPEASAFWDGETLRFGPGATRADAPGDDALEAHWRAYYASIFNPARLKTASMQAHMPKKYWANLPEAQLIPGLVDQASRRTGEMIAADAAQPSRRVITLERAPQAVAAPGSLGALRDAARNCRNCGLWERATQTVFGEGPARASVLFVGEQPGDQEDLAGRPFVGPSGVLFERALAAAGIPRESVYVTNAVKHFKFESRGKRRIHKTPAQVEMDACLEWLEREVALIGPRLVVCMGATAVRAITGLSRPIGELRGKIIPWREGTDLLVTVHPAALLRADAEDRDDATARFMADIALAAPFMAREGADAPPLHPSGATRTGAPPQ